MWGISITICGFLNKDEKIYVEPDISVICDKDKLNDRGCVDVPDFVIEVVSIIFGCRCKRILDCWSWKGANNDLLLRAGWSTDDKPIYSDDSKWDLWRIGD